MVSVDNDLHPKDIETHFESRDLDYFMSLGRYGSWETSFHTINLLWIAKCYLNEWKLRSKLTYSWGCFFNFVIGCFSHRLDTYEGYRKQSY